MPLPASWVDALFAKLVVRYGIAFMRQWSDIDIAVVKADWADALAHLESNPGAIKYALENLPPEPLRNVMQFRELCNRRPDAPLKALPAPQSKPDPAVLEKVRSFAAHVSTIPPRQWAQNLKAREERGDKLTRAQREMWREALRAGAGA